MPSAGQTTDAARIACVNIKVGDTVKRGDVLMEAETDKAVLPIESFAAGEVLAVLVAEGDDVDAGTVLAVIGKHGEGCAGCRAGCFGSRRTCANGAAEKDGTSGECGRGIPSHHKGR